MSLLHTRDSDPTTSCLQHNKSYTTASITSIFVYMKMPWSNENYLGRVAAQWPKQEDILNQRMVADLLPRAWHYPNLIDRHMARTDTSTITYIPMPTDIQSEQIALRVGGYMHNRI